MACDGFGDPIFGGAAGAALGEGLGRAEVEPGHLRGAVAAGAFGVEDFERAQFERLCEDGAQEGGGDKESAGEHWRRFYQGLGVGFNW